MIALLLRIFLRRAPTAPTLPVYLQLHAEAQDVGIFSPRTQRSEPAPISPIRLGPKAS